MMLATSVLSLLLTTGEADSTAEAKWRWYVACERPFSTRIVVALEGTWVFDATVPVCRVPEAQRTAQAERKVLRFWFRGNPAQFDAEAPSAPGSKIEGSVWQAGGETTGIVFGVSLQSSGRIILNTLHVADSDRRSQHPVAKGLVVSTTRFQGKRP